MVAGPAAGSVLPLPEGVTVVGRSTDCQLTLHDDEVSRRHLALTVSAETVRVRDLGSTNGLAVDGLAVSEASVADGAFISIGESVLTVASGRSDPAALCPAPGRGLRFNRPPRLHATPPDPVELSRPVAPVAPDRAKLPLVALLVPVALGAVLFATMPSSPQYLLLMAMSPLMVVGNLLSEGRGGRRKHRLAEREHAEALAAYEIALGAAVREDERTRRAEAPDPAELLARATLPSTTLWQRRATDPDVCLLRVGLADQPAAVRVRSVGAGAEIGPTARLVPATVDLASVGVLGVAGDGHPAAALTRWLVAQACVLIAPGDLQVVVLTTIARAAEWDWLRWLPHSAGDGARCRVLLGTDDTSRAARINELTRLTDARRSDHRRHPSGQLPRVLLVVDGARELRQAPGLTALLESGPTAGILAVCSDSQQRLLPQECSTVAVFQDGSGTRLTLTGPQGRLTDVLADQVDLAVAERAARAMAALNPVVAGSGDDGRLPTAARLIDLIEPGPDCEAIAAAWQAGSPTTEAVIGLTADGPLLLDLTADGPHTLIAGTTGAGKSELLQTLVVSLALANRPDALNFVLVDYKGGAAFRECARLPHTVGLVTDLDGRLTERALTSLSAELRRRERVLAANGAKDLETLWAAAPAGAPPPLSRLVIVIDEFATLVEELPDFVRGLVGLAQRGRSLGIHLVLATQRPGGVVSPDIRANTNLRICLRVTQSTESSDVIDAPDAGQIAAATPGRAFVRTGAGELRAFQTARVGGRAARTAPTTEGPRVTIVPTTELGMPPLSEVASAAADGPTDLSVLVEAITAASERLGLAAPARPWLDPLPELLTVDALAATHPSRDELVLPLGLIDVPDRQQQLPYGLELADGAHLLVAGAPRSGRSTVLQTLAGAVARTWSAEDLHLYGLDFGNQALGALTGLPHCGAVVTRDEPDRLERLLSRLQSEVERRQALFALEGYANLAEQRTLSDPDRRLPWILLLVDRWEGLVQSCQDVDLGRRIDELLRLLREGPAVGVRAVVTADRSGLIGRLPSVMADKLVLRLADRSDYALADIPARYAPTSLPPGRGLALGGGPSGTQHEVQIALLASDPAGPAQLAALNSLIAVARDREGCRQRLHHPIRVDPLPATISLEHALSLGPTASGATGAWALIGVGGDSLRPVGVDLAEDGPGFLVAGAPRSGRSTALVTMAESLLRGGRTVCLVAPGRSPLRSLAAHPGVIACLDEHANDEEARTAMVGCGRPPVVVVDDAERLTDTATGSALELLLKASPGSGSCVLAAGSSTELQNTYRGFTLDLRRSRCGLLLNPQSALDGDLVGARLPRQLGGRITGRALLALRGELTAVQVAHT